MTVVSVLDTRPDDGAQLEKAAAGHGIEWRFLDFRLTAETAPLARGAQAVCALVHDELARLVTFPNVIVTAHQALLTQEALSDIVRTIVANLEVLAAGRPSVEGLAL